MVAGATLVASTRAWGSSSGAAKKSGEMDTTGATTTAADPAAQHGRVEVDEQPDIQDRHHEPSFVHTHDPEASSTHDPISHLPASL